MPTKADMLVATDTPNIPINLDRVTLKPILTIIDIILAFIGSFVFLNAYKLLMERSLTATATKEKAYPIKAVDVRITAS